MLSEMGRRAEEDIWRSGSAPPTVEDRLSPPLHNHWGPHGLIGLSHILQDDMVRPAPVNGLPSRPASRNAYDESVEPISSAEADLPHLRHDSLQYGANGNKNAGAVPSVGPPSSYSYAAALSRSTTPDPQVVARAPSPCLTPIGGGRVSAASEKRGVGSVNSFNEPTDLVAALSGMNLSGNSVGDDDNHHHKFLFGLQGAQHLNKSESAKSLFSELGKSNGNGSNSFTKKGSPTSILNPQYQQLDSSNPNITSYGLSGYSVNPAMMANQLGNSNVQVQPYYDNISAATSIGVGMESRVLGGGQNMAASEVGRLDNQTQTQYVDPAYVQYLRASEYAALNDPSVADRSYHQHIGVGNSYMNLLELQKYLTLLAPQKSLYDVPLGGKPGGGSNNHHHGFYGNHSLFGISYPGSPMATPVSPMRHNELNMRFPSGMSRNMAGPGGLMGPWHLDAATLDEGFASSLLEEFKSNKTRSFELSEIAGHVVEFSADQYGSRFIQQKLETATTEEKNMVYQEIMPQALALMTDVFGNYVIQKFFEHGLASQRRELANKLFGHVLTLSLQMYGCRVIQKAIEVVDLDQKIKMVEELDGNIMRCVRDQNGNHVIQKCIECVPEEAIHFIVSTFFDQVVTLSTHPYGCRVIQRVLEHCEDPKTQSKVMDEILGAVSMLAQDQYGNYVVQHVLEHGKAHERSAIIKELAGKIVVMSQQKFASNVVEKCLCFGGPAERELLVNEMLGTTDENEPLQAMMKDQFANYVVQKVLETCDDQQRELILSRIKVHLNALKKYTYGKHIVARVEKLVAAGERRIAAQVVV